MAKTKNPIICIGGPSWDYDAFEPLISQVGEHFDKILANLTITKPDGTPTRIKLYVEASGDPEDTFARARRLPSTDDCYEIRMSSGLSYHVWLVSRVFESSAALFPWLPRVKILEKKYRKQGRKRILADFAYFVGSYAILLHEISHVVLGHCDYICDEMNLEWVNEFDETALPDKSEKMKIFRAFEAEADRQAGEFLSAFFDNALGQRGRGQHIQFPSRKTAYEFYTYAITLIFVLIQQLTSGKSGKHPLPQERQYIMISALTKYFSKYHPHEHDIITQHATLSAFEAGRKLGLLDAGDPQIVIERALRLEVTDEIIKTCGIRNYQHRFS